MDKTDYIYKDGNDLLDEVGMQIMRIHSHIVEHDLDVLELLNRSQMIEACLSLHEVHKNIHNYLEIQKDTKSEEV
jgi:hypothetical protein